MQQGCFPMKWNDFLFSLWRQFDSAYADTILSFYLEASDAMFVHKTYFWGKSAIFESNNHFRKKDENSCSAFIRNDFQGYHTARKKKDFQPKQENSPMVAARSGEKKWKAFLNACFALGLRLCI